MQELARRSDTLIRLVEKEAEENEALEAEERRRFTKKPSSSRGGGGAGGASAQKASDASPGARGCWLVCSCVWVWGGGYVFVGVCVEGELGETGFCVWGRGKVQGLRGLSGLCWCGLCQNVCVTGFAGL